MRILDWHINTNVRDPAAVLGYIPGFVSADDPRPAWEQFDERYVFGGWDAMLPGKWRLDADNYLHYPGDPPMAPLAHAYLRDELILVYPHAFVCIVQKNGDFSIARLD